MPELVESLEFVVLGQIAPRACIALTSSVRQCVALLDLRQCLLNKHSNLPLHGFRLLLYALEDLAQFVNHNVTLWSRRSAQAQYTMR